MKSDSSTTIPPFTVDIDFARLVMAKPDVHNKRPASAMRGYYKDGAALERIIAEGNDPMHYETFEKHVPEEYGHLLFCISKIQPGLVGEECFMTKGHYHTQINTGEIYFCLGGEGYMVMKTPEGLTNEQKMVRGSLVYVPPYWAHRSVNCGNEPLTMLAIWPADAGHNYGDIEKEGFPKRIFRRGTRIVIE